MSFVFFLQYISHLPAHSWIGSIGGHIQCDHKGSPILRVNGADPAGLNDGILAAYKFAIDAKLFDLSRFAANLPSFIPGNISCAEDPSPPWAYFRGDEDCVGSLRRLPFIQPEVDLQVPLEEKVTPNCSNTYMLCVLMA